MLPIRPGTPGRAPSLYDKCTGLFYMHYTTHGTTGFTSHSEDKALCVSVLLKDTGVMTGTRTHTLLIRKTPELESGALKGTRCLGSVELVFEKRL